jgi:zinc transporter 9
MLGNSGKIKGFWAVFPAIVGNFFVSIIKLIAYSVSGSSVMFSEAIHSFADTLNQSLLMVGLKRSTKKSNEMYVYGYGKERFFWALISACGIFFLGAGATVYRGVSELMSNDHVIHYSRITFFVLLASFLIESYTLLRAYQELKRNDPKSSVRKMLKNGDPASLAVLFEDGLAVIGIIIASLMIYLTNITGQIYWDALGSILIGLLLGVVAVILIIKNRAYLIGKTMPRSLRKEIVKMLEADPIIEKVIDFKSTTLDIGIYRIKCEIEFNGNYLVKEIFNKEELREEYEDIKNDFEEFKKFYVDYADRIPRLIGRKIDEIETTIRSKHQGVKYIDIEIN